LYDAAEADRDSGTNLAFFGSNAVFWSIELQSAPTDPHRRIHTPKDWNADRWREQGRPEQELIGVQLVSPNEYPNTDHIVTNGSDPVWAGTGLGNGSVVPGVTGYEIDHLDPAHPGPNGVQRLLSASPFAGNSQQTSIYTAPSGATVFGSGTMSWAWALARTGFENAGIQQATRNILGPA